MSETFITFQKFTDKAAALQLGDVLKENNIEFIIEDTSSSFEPTFSNNELSKEYRVKLKQEHFETAEKLLQKISLAEIDLIDKDHYLFSFSDEELMEIIDKPDEWSQLDYLMAQKILKEKGKEVSSAALESKREQRIKELAEPEKSQITWIAFGYIFALLGGLLALFIGWHLLSHKKTLPNGEKVHAYSIADRKDGNRIFILGLLFMIFWICIRIFVWHA